MLILLVFSTYFNQKFLRKNLNPNFHKIKISSTYPASKHAPHKEIYFNQKCHRNNLISNFAKTNISNTSPASKQTRRILIHNFGNLKTNESIPT
jgi:hypothetical protein